MMSYKKIAFLGAALLATGVNAHSGPFKGGYVGLQGGVSHLNSKIDVDFGNGVNDFTEMGLSDTNVSGGLHFGWLFPYGERWVFGLEARGEFSGINAKENQTVNLGALQQVKYTLKENYNAGLAAKIGYKFNKDTLVYLKLGARLSEFKLTYQDLTNGVASPSNSQKKTKVGFEPGLGVTFKFCEGERGYWSAFGEYSYTFYGSNNFDNMDNTGGDRFPTASIRERIGRMTLGVSYHF